MRRQSRLSQDSPSLLVLASSDQDIQMVVCKAPAGLTFSWPPLSPFERRLLQDTVDAMSDQGGQRGCVPKLAFPRQPNANRSPTSIPELFRRFPPPPARAMEFYHEQKQAWQARRLSNFTCTVDAYAAENPFPRAAA